MFIVLGLLIPNTYRIERSIIVNAPVHYVFEEVSDLKRWGAWEPWKEIDPYMEISYEPSSSEKSTSPNWKEEKKRTNKGRQKIVRVIQNKRIVIDDSISGFTSSTTYWDFEPIEGGKYTKITWSNEEKMNFVNIYRKYGFFSANSRLGMIYEKSFL